MMLGRGSWGRSVIVLHMESCSDTFVLMHVEKFAPTIWFQSVLDFLLFCADVHSLFLSLASCGNLHTLQFREW